MKHEMPKSSEVHNIHVKYMRYIYIFIYNIKYIEYGLYINYVLHMEHGMPKSSRVYNMKYMRYI